MKQMNLFDAIRGNKEEIASAILNVLLNESPEIQSRFLNVVADVCESGPIVNEDFKCATEKLTADERGRGRIDLLIETDNVAIGVENKLSAGFTPEQPEKYWKPLQKHKKKHCMERHSLFCYCPSSVCRKKR